MFSRCVSFSHVVSNVLELGLIFSLCVSCSHVSFRFLTLRLVFSRCVSFSHVVSNVLELGLIFSLCVSCSHVSSHFLTLRLVFSRCCSFYFRLTPVYMLVLMVFTTLMKYWLSGPMWPTENVPFDNCKESWWTNLLYINNFVNTENSVSMNGTVCL